MSLQWSTQSVYKGMDQSVSSVKHQRSADGPQLSKFVETATIHTTLFNAILHRQHRIKDDAKVSKGHAQRRVGTHRHDQPASVTCSLSLAFVMIQAE